MVQAQGDAISALRAGVNDGFKTMVLAPSTAADVSDLNALAVAGGLPRATNGIQFNTEATLGDQLTPISTGTECTFPLISPPPVPDNVTVTFNGAPVPRDTSHANGWDYTDGNAMYFQLYGDWCLRVIEGESFQITALYGCP
jgi:hypothetical protein